MERNYFKPFNMYSSEGQEHLEYLLIPDSVARNIKHHGNPTLSTYLFFKLIIIYLSKIKMGIIEKYSIILNTNPKKGKIWFNLKSMSNRRNTKQSLLLDIGISFPDGVMVIQ
jgi:hypothetical protein